MDLWPSSLNNSTIVSSHFICLHYSSMLILIDEDTLKKKGRREEGERNSCKSTVHTAKSITQKKCQPSHFGKDFFLSPASLLSERLEVGHKQCFRHISNHRRGGTSHCNQPGKSMFVFLMKKC